MGQPQDNFYEDVEDHELVNTAMEYLHEFGGEDKCYGIVDFYKDNLYITNKQRSALCNYCFDIDISFTG